MSASRCWLLRASGAPMPRRASAIMIWRTWSAESVYIYIYVCLYIDMYINLKNNYTLRKVSATPPTTDPMWFGCHDVRGRHTACRQMPSTLTGIWKPLAQGKRPVVCCLYGFEPKWLRTDQYAHDDGDDDAEGSLPFLWSVFLNNVPEHSNKTNKHH